MNLTKVSEEIAKLKREDSRVTSKWEEERNELSELSRVKKN